MECTQGKHNIYITRHGDLKLQLVGQQYAIQISPPELISKLAKYDYKSTELYEIQSLAKKLERLKGKTGIYVDAGFRNGKARITAINMQDIGIDIAIREIDCNNHIEAEKQAIELAESMWDGIIYTDCQQLQNGNVVWIPRTENKEADSLANLREGR